MIARQAYFAEKDDLFQLESLSFKDSEVMLEKDGIRLCVPGPKVDLFRSTDIVDSHNNLLYELDVIQIGLTYLAQHLVGYTIIRYVPKVAGFVLDDFVAMYPETGETFLEDERYIKIFSFGSLASLIQSPCHVLRRGNYYEVEKGASAENMRAMFGINKIKKDLSRENENTI